MKILITLVKNVITSVLCVLKINLNVLDVKGDSKELWNILHVDVRIITIQQFLKMGKLQPIACHVHKNAKLVIMAKIA
jgi:hypothetical protein